MASPDGGGQIALLVLAGVALTALWAAHAHRHPAAPAGSAAAQVAMSARGSGELSRLSAEAQSVISSMVGAADRRFAPTRRMAGYRLAGGRVTVALGRGGISVDGDGARLALGLLAVGRPGRMRQLAEVTPTVARSAGGVHARARGTGSGMRRARSAWSRGSRWRTAHPATRAR